MRKAVRMCAVLLLIGAAGIAAVAQDAAPRRGMGGFMRSSGDTVSDILVLPSDQAEKVAEASQQAMEASREGFDFQNMSQEERRDAFTKMSEKYATAMAEKLKPILSEQQLKDIEPFLTVRGIRTRADMRALRQLDLKEEQRKELQPLALAFAKVVLEDRQQSGQGGGFGGQQEDSEKVTKAHDEFQAAAAKVLSAEQNEAWKKKTEEVQAEMQRQREQMRQGRGQ